MESSIAFVHGHLQSQLPPRSDHDQWSWSSSPSSRSTGTYKRPIVIPRRVSDALQAKGFEIDGDGIVRWASDSTTTIHPRKWPLLRKVFDTAIICFLEFFVTLISNTGSSMAPEVSMDLDIDKESAVFYITTIYLLGQASGGLIFPPIAESFGERTIYLTSTFGFALFSLCVTVWPTLPVVIFCRFVTGLLSAMPAVVAAGSLENMWDMRSRTFVIHIWISTAVVGLSLGPPVATFASTSQLRW